MFEGGSTTLTRTVKAHTGSVYTLHPVGGPGGLNSDNPGGLWSGGKDGLVKHYDQQVQRRARRSKLGKQEDQIVGARAPFVRRLKLAFYGWEARYCRVRMFSNWTRIRCACSL